jgi:hypothetical protein
VYACIRVVQSFCDGKPKNDVGRTRGQRWLSEPTPRNGSPLTPLIYDFVGTLDGPSNEDLGGGTCPNSMGTDARQAQADPCDGDGSVWTEGDSRDVLATHSVHFVKVANKEKTVSSKGEIGDVGGSTKGGKSEVVANPSL